MPRFKNVLRHLTYLFTGFQAPLGWFQAQEPGSLDAGKLCRGLTDCINQHLLVARAEWGCLQVLNEPIVA
jgi:hypothetical protein